MNYNNSWRKDSTRQSTSRPPNGRVKNIPDFAVGRILGKGGENIKRLQQVDGVQKVIYDKVTKEVHIWGDSEAVRIVEASVQKSISLATNSDGYIPEKGCFFMDANSAVNFTPFQNVIINPTVISSLSSVRDFYLVTFAQNSQFDPPDLSWGSNEESVGIFKPFFAESLSTVSVLSRLRSNQHRSDIHVRFGKVYFSNLTVQPYDIIEPSEFDMRVRPEHKGGSKTTFVGEIQNRCCARFEEILVQEGYLPLGSISNEVTIHCVDTEKRERYTIDLKYPADVAGGDMNRMGELEYARLVGARTLYDVLGLPVLCDAFEIKRAFEVVKSKIHPDKNGFVEAATALTLVEEAFDTLEDPELRALYDAKSAAEQQPSIRLSPMSSSRNKTKPPVISSVERNVARHFVHVNLRSAQQIDSRLTFLTHRIEATSSSILAFIGEGWDKKEGDTFDTSVGTFRVDGTRLKTKKTFTNGVFDVSFSSLRGECFHNDLQGTEISIRSLNLGDLLASIPSLSEEDYPSISALVEEETERLLRESLNLATKFEVF